MKSITVWTIGVMLLVGGSQARAEIRSVLVVAGKGEDAGKPAAKPDERQKEEQWGLTNQGLQMSIATTGKDKAGNPEFQVAFRSLGEQDVTLNLGMMLANGKPLNGGRSLFPLHIRLNLTDAKGKTRELHVMEPPVAGRVDDYVVPLRVGSVHALRLPLSQFWSSSTKEFALELKPGSYQVSAHFEGGGATRDSGKWILNFWEGKLQSNTLELEVKDAQKAKDAEKGKPDAALPIRSLPGHADRLTSVAYSADGKSIATSSWDGTVRIWDAKTGKEQRRMESDTKLHTRFNQIVFSPDDAFIVTSVRESEGVWVAVVWSCRTGEKVRTLPAEAGSVAVSPDGSLIACGGYRIIRLYEFATGKLVREMHDKDEKQLRMQSLIFSSDGKSLVSTGHAPTPPRREGLGGAASDPEVIRVWDVASGKVRPSALNGLFVVPFGRKIALSPDGRTLVVQSGNGNGLSLLEAATRGERAKLTGHKSAVSDFAFLPDGRTLASAGSDGTVRLWDLPSGKEIGRFGKVVDLSKGWVVALDFSPDGRSLVSGGLDKTAHIWDVSKITGRPRVLVERSAAELEADWKDLVGDPAKAYAALGRLVSSPKQAVSFLGKHLESVKPADTKRIEQLIGKLNDGRFEVRQQATKDLEALAEYAVPLVQKALAGNVGLEGRRRLEALLEGLEGASLSAETVRQIRAVEAMESIGNPEAFRLLEKLATGPPDMRLTQEALASSRRLAKRSSDGP